MAAADSVRVIRNAPYRFHFKMRTITTGQVLSGDAANLDAEVSLASAAFADIVGAETEIGSTGIYYVDMTAAEMTAAGSIYIRIISSTANTDEIGEELFPEPCSDSGVAQSAAASTLVIRAAASAVDDFYNGQQVEIVRGTGAGQVRSITDYTGASKTCAIDRAWITNPDNTSVYLIKGQGASLATDGLPNVNVAQINNNAAAAVALAYLYKAGFDMGSVNDAGATTTVWIGDSGLSAIDDFYNGAQLVFVSGALAGVMERVSDYVGATRTFTMDHAFPASPANADQFVILGKVR